MEHKTEPLIFKSSLFNALLPDFLKHLFWNSTFFLFLYGIYMLVDYSANLSNDLKVILWLIGLTILFSIIKISKDVFMIVNTTYTLNRTNMEVKFKFITEDTHSINYNMITDLQISKNIWDRICGVGTLVMHTSNDTTFEQKSPMLVLKDIKNPDKIKEEITKRRHSLHPAYTQQAPQVQH